MPKTKGWTPKTKRLMLAMKDKILEQKDEEVTSQ